MPDTATLLAYSAASIALFITPGPDMSLFLARTIASGRRAGIASVFGANLGCVIHTFLAAFGISALVAASHTGFLILKIVGAGYLLWLAVDAIRNGSSLNVGTVEQKSVSTFSSFLMGVPVNLTNDKGDTLLILAAYHGHPETVAALLDRGADHDRVNDRGQTALAAAVFRQSEPAVAALLAAGADADAGIPSARATAVFFELPAMAALLDARA